MRGLQAKIQTIGANCTLCDSLQVYGESLLADILGMLLWISSKAHWPSVENSLQSITSCMIIQVIQVAMRWSWSWSWSCYASATADQTFDKYGRSAACGSEGKMSMKCLLNSQPNKMKCLLQTKGLMNRCEGLTCSSSLKNTKFA